MVTPASIPVTSGEFKRISLLDFDFGRPSFLVSLITVLPRGTDEIWTAHQAFCGMKSPRIQTLGGLASPFWLESDSG
jgi:hypothetical protein